jgi:hypothetical protein
MSGTSRMRRESHVRICERLGVRLPGPTRQLVGDFKNGGRELRPKGDPEPVRVHDFAIRAQALSGRYRSQQPVTQASVLGFDHYVPGT